MLRLDSLHHSLRRKPQTRHIDSGPNLQHHDSLIGPLSQRPSQIGLKSVKVLLRSRSAPQIDIVRVEEQHRRPGNPRHNPDIWETVPKKNGRRTLNFQTFPTSFFQPRTAVERILSPLVSLSFRTDQRRTRNPEAFAKSFSGSFSRTATSPRRRKSPAPRVRTSPDQSDEHIRQCWT